MGSPGKDLQWDGKGYIRYRNVGYLRGRMVDLIIVSRESDGIMKEKCNGALPPPVPSLGLGPHAARHNYTAALP